MTIDHFTPEQFEEACHQAGFEVELHHIDGEYVYDCLIDWRTAVRVRSSIWRDGHSAGTGQDSIRLWMVERSSGEKISSLPIEYITRVPGWVGRLQNAMQALRTYRSLSGDCPHCTQPLYVYRSTRDNANKGRLFTSCFNKACGKTFRWLESTDKRRLLPAENVYFFQETSLGVDAEQDLSFQPSPTGDPSGAASSSATGPREQEGSLIGPEQPANDPVSVDVQIAAGHGESSASIPEEVQPSAPSALDALEELEDAETALMAATTQIVVKQTRIPNVEQVKAIYAPINGSYRVLAPPGSGKTFLLVRRLQFLLNQGVPMQNILLVCFNVNSADELYGRIISLMPELSNNLYVKSNTCTIHAACYRMLRNMGDQRKLPEENSWKIKKFIQDAARQLWDEDLRPNWKEIISWIYTAKSYGLSNEQFLPFFMDALGEYAQGIESIRQGLAQFMYENQWITFADMLYEAERQLEENPRFRKVFQTLYKYILVDEGQDVAGQAMRILTRLAQPEDNFFIVGDTDQLMYRFTGATPEANLFDGFEQRFPGGRMIKLATNYRSTRQIVTTSNQLIVNNYNVGGGPYDDKYIKEVQTRADAPEGVPVDFVMLETPEEEGRDIVTVIANRLNEGGKPGDIFVGARTRAQLTYVEPFLLAAQIPFLNVCGSSFWDSRHIQDVLAFLRVAYDRYDEEAFGRIYNIASADYKATWGDQQGEHITHHFLPRAFLQSVPNYDRCFKAMREYRFPFKYSWKDGMEDICSMVTEIQFRLSHEGIFAALETIIEICYRKYLAVELGVEDDVDGGPLEDLNTLVHLAKDFKSVPDLFQHIKKAQEQAKNVKGKDWSQYVILSTIHGLKGLERPVVFGMGFCEGERELPNGVRVPAGLLPHTFSMTPPPNLGILPGEAQGRIEDERCIAYVLVTRAKDECHLSGCATYGGARMHPSRFVVEMGLVPQIEDGPDDEFRQRWLDSGME